MASSGYKIERASWAQKVFRIHWRHNVPVYERQRSPGVISKRHPGVHTSGTREQPEWASSSGRGRWWGSRHACHAPEEGRARTNGRGGARTAADTNDNNLSLRGVTLPGIVPHHAPDPTRYVSGVAAAVSPVASDRGPRPSFFRSFFLPFLSFLPILAAASSCLHTRPDFFLRASFLNK